MLRDVLSGEEAARMVAIAERMGFEVGEGAGAGRTSAAVSWCFHEDLTLTLTIALALALTLTLTLTRCFAPCPMHATTGRCCSARTSSCCR